VCLLVIILVFISAGPAFTQTSRTILKIKDLPTIFPDPNIQFAEPGQSPWGFDCLASTYPYDPNRKDDKEEAVIKQYKEPLNYYYWLLNYFPLLEQVVLGP
jgi:hypothetical protein